jgi:hypothetical protein
MDTLFKNGTKKAPISWFLVSNQFGEFVNHTPIPLKPDPAWGFTQH